MYESAERHLTGYRYGRLTNASHLDLIDTDRTEWDTYGAEHMFESVTLP